MAETRARPARERQRFHLVARANMWFYSRMLTVDDQSWDVVSDWEALHDGMKIRRFNNANPQDAADQGSDDATEPVGESGTRCSVTNPNGLPHATTERNGTLRSG